jgi:hypothetical protein
MRLKMLISFPTFDYANNNVKRFILACQHATEQTRHTLLQFYTNTVMFAYSLSLCFITSSDHVARRAKKQGIHDCVDPLFLYRKQIA